MKSYKNLKKVEAKVDFPQIEEKILNFWQKEKIFEESLKIGDKDKNFVFFEGPPTMNGYPGLHHAISRAFKDLIPRYKTMRGYYVKRIAGWDTHGLPVELETEKILGISGKPDIEKLKKTKAESIAYFNQQCDESTKKYKEKWEEFSQRIGFWLDYKHPYITSKNTYIESLWWIIKQIWDKGLIYRDYKVLPYCPRCGTSLSSHEVAQGYKDISENSIYVKFPIKDQKNTYILAWTTTPWTLPGNVALAVGKNIDYIKVEDKKTKELYILAKARKEILGDEKNYKTVETFRGAELEGLLYDPIFSGAIPKQAPNYANTYKIYLADFVSTTDGTGVVHTAVMYGEDDFVLGKKFNLPQKHTVDSEGKFTNEIGKWAGKFVFDVNDEIIENLKKRNLLLKTQNITHSYPFCWRCDTKLIYYAKESWFIQTTKLQKQLIRENQKINWYPEFLKEGRFGEWLREVRDWAFSRDRYWGTPLPIWKCTNKDCQNTTCIGSIDELSAHTQNSTKLILVRHGEAQHNLENIYSSSIDDKYDLTDKGREQTKKVGERLKNSKIDTIFASDLLRTKTSAEILSKILKVDIKYEKVLREISLGDFQGKHLKEVLDLRKKDGFYETPFPGGESIKDVKNRVGEFIETLRKNYRGKAVLIVTHEDVIRAILVYLDKLSEKNIEFSKILNGYYLEIKLSPAKNLHRPYIDDVLLSCEKCGNKMKREEAVCDVWFDSGAMPFAQSHYPFENKENIDDKIQYPADYIAEAIDQTRGWFYTLLAVATLVGFERPYKNVISLGHILDKNGKKMSKSKGNIIKPEEILEKYGADVLRWYFFTINQPQDAKNFDTNDLLKSLRKEFLILWNIYSFLITYSKVCKVDLSYVEDLKAKKLIDRFILSATYNTTKEVCQALDNYDVTRAARILETFTNTLSTKYLKWNRDRFIKNPDPEAFQTLYRVLMDLLKMLAPFIPFITEEIYQNLKSESDPKSIHLCKYPSYQEDLMDKKLFEKFGIVSDIISASMFDRAKAGIKVRQPLSALRIKTGIDLDNELLEIIKNEVNVKKVVIEAATKNEFDFVTDLDKNITPELKLEGQVRELTRIIQDTRKKAELLPGQKVDAAIVGLDKDLQNKLKPHIKKLLEDTNLTNLVFSEIESDIKETFQIDSQAITIFLKK